MTNTTGARPLTCAKCHDTAERLLIIALLQACGARAYPSAEVCNAGGKHDFRAAATR